jgi:PAS domain S-box-containing protein
MHVHLVVRRKCVCMVESVVQPRAKIVVCSDEKMIRVLHVDDELGLLKVAKQCLESQGPFQVDTASSVEEALNKLKEKEYDAVVSDYQMPEKDGLEFLETLRKSGNNSPFILFTGKGREEVAVKALNLGADQYLSKTGDPETVYRELEHAIRKTVEQKKAEKALETCGERYGRLFESAVEGILINGSDGRVTSLNPAAASILGYDCPKELIGKPAVELYVDHDSRARLLQELMEKGHIKERELTWKKKDGTLIEILASITVQKDEKGNLLRTEGIIRDISEKKRSERLLREREEKYKELAESISDVFFAMDKDLRYTYWNKASEELTGIKAEDVIGKSFTEVFSDTKGAKVEQFYRNAMKTKQHQTLLNEYQIGGKDFIFELNAYPSRDGLSVFAKDITERKKAEEALRLSEEKYKGLFENAGDVIVLFDLKGNVTSVNKAAEEEYGFNKSGMLGKSMLKFVSKKHWPKLLSDIAQISLGKMAKGKIDIHTPKGDKIAEYRSNPIFSDNRVVGIQTILEDITEREGMEKTIRESEEKWRSLVDMAPDGILAVNVEGIVTSVNRSFLTLVGYDSEEEIVGKPFTKLKTSRLEDIPKMQELFESLMKGESPSPREFLYVRRDGTSRWAEVHSSLLVKDGKPVGAQVIMRDVTERKNAEKLNQESQQKFEQLFMSNPEAAVYVDPNERVLNVNPRFTELFGYSFDEVKEKFLDDFLAPEDRKQEASMLAQKGKEGYLYHETVRKNKKGSLIPVALSSAPLMLQGQHLGDIVLYKDITERKKAEEQRNRLTYDLNERVKELTCLYGLSKIIAKHGYSIEEIMQDTVFLLPPAFQHPDIVCARIVWEDHKYTTGNFRETRWSQKADIKMHGKIIGAVEVYYVKEKPGRDKELFLNEEKNLLDAVAERLGRSIERVRERTLRQNEERATRESQRKFEGLFRHNPEAAVYLDLSFKILDVNPRFCQLFGYSAEEVIGRNINDVVAPEDMREEAESMDIDSKNGYASHNTIRKRKDGSLVPVSISAAPVTFENKQFGYVGIYKDITELKRAQEESEESRRHFQMLFDLMADPVAVVDGRGKILEVTQRVEEITGFKKEELVGKSLLKVNMFGAKTKAVMIKNLAKRMMGMHLQPYEVEVLKKDGGKLMYEINAAKISYKGKPADLVVFRDILERKNLEEKLRVVGSLTRHDVRNKLSAVTGNVYLLRRKLAGNPEAMEHLADMESAVRNVEAIFEFARTYEKLGVEQLVNMSVGKAVDEALALFPDLKGIRIANECEGLTVLADSLLRQLFYNLIDDSLKYGEKLTQIRVRYEKFGDKLKLIYEDDGVGVSKDNKAKIFTEGFTTGKGSGYGLYLVRRMMDVYGWAIQETGTPGNGVCFTVVIPEKNHDGRENYRLH